MPSERKIPTMDFPQAWEFVRGTEKEDHDRKCSWRVAGMLCDCSVLWNEYNKRRIADLQSQLEQANERAEALSKPVSKRELMDAMASCPEQGERMSARLNRIIAARLSATASEVKP